jgi:hypothetical protein
MHVVSVDEATNFPVLLLGLLNCQQHQLAGLERQKEARSLPASKGKKKPAACRPRKAKRSPQLAGPPERRQLAGF